MRLLIVTLILSMAAPCFAGQITIPYLHITIQKQHEEVAEARAAQIKQKTADEHADAVQKRRHREQNHLQRQVYEQQELSRRQRQYSEEQKVQQQRIKRQNETRIIGW